MKTPRPALNWCAVAALLATLCHTVTAAEITVGGYSLDGWAVTGGQPPPSPSPQALVLPAGSSISRSFPVSELQARVTTQPTFSQSVENWPILAVGSTFLAFIREGGEGKLALIVDQRAPEILPFSFKLDGADRALVPVELEVARNRTNVSVTCGGKTVQFPAAAVSSLEITIVGSASQPWVIDRLAVAFSAASDPSAPAPSAKPAPNIAKIREALAAIVRKPVAEQSEPKPNKLQR